MKMEKCLVLLSSYNGEHYIKEQIESILSQKGVRVKVLVRDDGSKDKTIDILNSIKDERIDIYAGKNVGCIASFSWLVNYAYKNYSEYEYFAFADQDDFWMENKLNVGVSKLLEYNKNCPNLYFCNMELVNSKLSFVCLMRNHDIDMRKGNIWLGGRAAGCTMVFNKKALEMYAEHNPNYCYHDFWMNLIALYFGKVYYDTNPYIKYRQHEFNVLGAHGQVSKKARNKERLTYWFKDSKSKAHHNCAKDFLIQFDKELHDEDRKVIDIYIEYHKSLLGFMRFLVSKQFCSKEPERTCLRGRCLYFIRALFGKY